MISNCQLGIIGLVERVSALSCEQGNLRVRVECEFLAREYRRDCKSEELGLW